MRLEGQRNSVFGHTHTKSRRSKKQVGQEDLVKFVLRCLGLSSGPCRNDKARSDRLALVLQLFGRGEEGIGFGSASERLQSMHLVIPGAFVIRV